MRRGMSFERRREAALFWAAVAAACATPFAFYLYTDQIGPTDVPDWSSPIAMRHPPPHYPDARTTARMAAAARFEAMRPTAEAGCLAEAMYYEARGEGVDGQKAVAEVVLQRTHDSNHPRTICGVVHEGVLPGRQDCQFTYACDGSMRRPKEIAVWTDVRQLAERIVTGAVKLANATGYAVAYHSIAVTPAWAGTMEKTTQIGNHIFYRPVPRPPLVHETAKNPRDSRGNLSP